MTNLEIYVYSSALGKTGYHWRKIESEEHQPQEEPILIKTKVIEDENLWVNNLIDPYKPSLVILRNNPEKKLLLEITGIESPERSNKLGRKVLNSLVLITDDNQDNESVLRTIAYLAIQNILGYNNLISQIINESVYFYQLEEFRANLKELNQFFENLNLVKSEAIDRKSQDKIETSSPENLENLAEELQSYSFPQEWVTWDGKIKTDGVLVVVTDNLEEATLLHKAGVWRGFATEVKKPKIEVVESTEKKTELPPISPEEKPKPINQKRSVMMIVLVIAIALLLTLTILCFPVQAPTQPPLSPQTLNQPSILPKE